MKTYIYFILFVALVVGGIFVFKDKGDNTTGNSVIPPSTQQGQTQNVVLGIKNYNYYPNTINVKVNEQVEISLDSSVTGCFRSFNVKDLGISKYAKTPSDKIVFTPTQKGTFKFACSMGMGYGTLVVE
jgi:plastocyanin domain-containing protein